MPFVDEHGYEGIFVRGKLFPSENRWQLCRRKDVLVKQLLLLAVIILILANIAGHY